jgi:hypothetical protein
MINRGHIDEPGRLNDKLRASWNCQLRVPRSPRTPATDDPLGHRPRAVGGRPPGRRLRILEQLGAVTASRTVNLKGVRRGRILVVAA